MEDAPVSLASPSHPRVGCNIMKLATPPISLPPPPPPTDAASQLLSTLKQTRKATWLRSLATRPAGAETGANKDNVDDTVCKSYGISKEKWTKFCYSRRDPSWEDVRKKAQAIQKQNTAPNVLSRWGYEYLEKKLMDEKTKKKLEEVAQSRNTDTVIDPPSPIK
ncbi:hypothetical protein HKD37_20G056253 [Glycine soja]